MVSMFVAHTAPFDAPGVVREVSNLLTAALFATLVGVGAGLERSAGGRWWPPLVRGAALVVTGVVLVRVDSFIIIVLIHLGLLTWLVALLARCPTWCVAGVGVIGFFASPLLLTALADDAARLEATGPGWAATVLELVATGDSYRLTAFVAWAALGLVLARVVLRDDGHAAAGLLAGAGALVVAALLLAEPLGWPVVPYAGDNAEFATNALMAGGTLLVGVGVTRLLSGRGLGWLAAVGRMTLTLYALQVVALALLEGRVTTGSPIGWPVLLGLVVGSVALAVGWAATPACRWWGRGPLEGAVARVAHLDARRVGASPSELTAERARWGRMGS